MGWVIIWPAGVVAAADGNRGPASAAAPRAEAIRAAVNRALPLLVKASVGEYPRHRDCFSCHNQAVPAVALDLARRHGFAVEAETLRAIAEHTESDLNTAIADYHRGKGQPGGVIRAGYALWALEAAGWPPDETTAAVAHYLAVAPGRGDHWGGQGNRPPSEASDFTATALALRGLRAFESAEAVAHTDPARGQPALGRDPAARRARALEWLRQTRPRETEERVFRLWGLKLAEADPQDRDAAVADLLRTQRPDGGWSQLDGPGPAGTPGASAGRVPASALASDAYATGSALVALHLAGGVATDRPAYRRGLGFLIKAQRDDGSWFVKSRSRPFQTYFESGFPHGPNQFISAAASGWAVAALAMACPVP
ncbi:MAG TPA: hypothetical protein VFF52_23195 [Isosphaeraceae bacterium]|nr:hypothetical protein [Isosphaeraceae bacterium]